MARFEAFAVSALRSNLTPVVTKKTGMKNPNPIASSLRRNSGWVMTWSRSSSEMIAPATNAPRITSRPSCSATAAKPMNRTSAARTRICAVVSWRRSRSARMRTERSAPRTTKKTTIPRSASAPSSSSVDPAPPSPEKNRVSRMIAPKSAIEAAETISWPNVDEISPASLSTGTITPSDVAQRMIATSSGVCTRPAVLSPNPTTTATPNESAKPSAVSRSTRPRSFSNSISSPARKSTKARPISAITAIDWSTSTMPSTDGPTTMPATISSTTEGSRRLGTSPSTKGAANATATTIKRSPKCGIRRPLPTSATPRRSISSRRDSARAMPG